MKNIALLLVILCLTLISPIIAQELVLDPEQYVNTQILGDTLADGSRAHTVYKLERSQLYAFDGRMDITFRCEIIGPDNGGMIHDKAEGHPPVVVNTPDPTTGAARDFAWILVGGELVLKNFIMSGLVSTGNYSGDMMSSVGGKLFEAENMVFCDWNERVFRSYFEGIDVSVKDCVFMNGGSGDFGVFDGMSIRFNVQGNSYVLENNTFINTGRCICNAGPFLKMKTTILHNSLINCPKCAHEMRHNEFISANNYWYNWEFVGYGPNQIRNNDIYQMNFTTSNDYIPISDKLDSVSCYFGQNGFYIEAPINEWFAERTPEDSIHQSGYWEIEAVDSFVLNDDNYKIGTNYEGFDPVFPVPPTKTADLVAFIDAYWQNPQPAVAPNYDPLPHVVEFPDGGAPVCNWPLPFDLSYSNETWKTGGSDGLPLGDLNWFPEAKDTYLANREQIITALKDSMLNAKAIYKPPARTPFITPTTSVEGEHAVAPVEFSLAQNYPNPFNPSTTINYTILKADHVSLEIYNVLGQKVRTLVDNTQLAGLHSVKWDGNDDAGNMLADGIYFYKLKSGARTSTKKMVLMK
ncbi:T9SS type A sorting domain-containing protein [candidate division KSB1 bacterium]|nr:T9SS type A sorting domain-containing protein [candidate division KSB1 bacterium]